MVSKPLNSCLDDLLKVVGADRKTVVAVIGLGSDSRYCRTHLCVDVSTGFDIVAKNVAGIVRDGNASSIKFVLGDADALTSTAVYILYTIFSTVEVFSDLKVDPLGLVHANELIEIDFKPRLPLDLRDLRLLTGLSRCRTGNDIASELGMPKSSVRRKLSNMSRKGILNTVCLGRAKVYCPTTLAKMVSYVLTQMLL